MIESPATAEIDAGSTAPEASRTATPRRYGALAGLVSGGLAVTTGMLAARVIDVVSPIDAVGSEFIDRVPAWLKELAIQWFGTNDKLALRIGIVATLAIAALVVGVLAVRWLGAGIVGIAVFGLIGILAAVHRPGESNGAAVPPLIGTAVGIPLLIVLIHPTRPRRVEMPGRSRVPLGWDRRRFLVATGSAAAAAAAAGGIAELLERRRVESIRETIPDSLPRLLEPGAPAITVPAEATLSPITPFITPNDDFYRIDTALSFPRINLTNWKVDITGLVERPLTLTYDELIARPQIERIITLCCVSNEVGGDLISTATFQGVLLADLLDEAGVKSGAEQVFSTSLDGWTCGFPVSVALDGRDAMVAVGMNGEPLPLEHGFPARLVVPGLYGYVSATKWLRTIKVTTWDAAEGYWVPRGWAREAPVKTQSRIDVPRKGQRLPAGPVKVAGVAWAQHRGVDKVEVRVDENPWQTARLGTDVTDDAWRQWVLEWDAEPGKHVIQVRATDKNGDTQTDEVARPDPDGATGYHTRSVTVE